MPKTAKKTKTATIEKPEEKEPGMFARFADKKKFFVGIKANDEGMVPAHGYSIAGITFPVFTQTPIATDGSQLPGRPAKKVKGTVWLTLSNAEAGDFLELTHEQVAGVLEDAPFYLVKWQRGYDEDRDEEVTRRAKIVHLLQKNLAPDKKNIGQWVETTYMHDIAEGDEPLAKYLVLIPGDKLSEYGDRQDIDDLPSLVDLCPEMAKPPKRK